MAGAAKPNEKPYCPPNMARFDGSFPIGLTVASTVWVCENCSTCVLSQEAIVPHLTRCNGSSHKYKLKPTKKDEDIAYICAFCNRLFSRKVALKSHLKVHDV